MGQHAGHAAAANKLSKHDPLLPICKHHACEVHVRLHSQMGGMDMMKFVLGRLGFGDARKRRAGDVSPRDSDAAGGFSRPRCVQLDQLVCRCVCWSSVDGEERNDIGTLQRYRVSVLGYRRADRRYPLSASAIGGVHGLV